MKTIEQHNTYTHSRNWQTEEEKKKSAFSITLSGVRNPSLKY